MTSTLAPSRAPASPGHRLGAGIVTTYLARFASMIALVALVPVVLGAVGPAPYGVYILTVAVGALFQQDLGIGDATTRFIAVAHAAGDEQRMRRIAAASWAFYLGTAVVMGGLTAAAFAVIIPNTHSIPGELTETAWILAGIGAVNVFVIVLMSTNRQILAGVGRLHEVNLLLIAQAVLKIALTVLVCALGLGIVAVGLVDLAVSIGFGCAVAVLRMRRAPAIRTRLAEFRPEVFGELFRVSSQLMVMGVTSVVIMQAGGVLSALLLPIAATALCAVAQRSFLVVKEVTNSLGTAILPTASSHHGRGDDAAIRTLYLRGTSLANMLMTIVLVPVISFMPQIMAAWIGPTGAGAVLTAQVLILSMFANNNHLLAIPALTAQGTMRGYAILHSIWAVTGVVLAYVLGQHLGLVGIALGLSIPIVLLEPVYVAIALSRLRIATGEFVVACLLRPFAVVAVPAITMFVLARLVEPDLATAIAWSAAWVVVATALYVRFGLDAATRAHLRRRVTERRPTTRARAK